MNPVQLEGYWPWDDLKKARVNKKSGEGGFQMLVGRIFEDACVISPQFLFHFFPGQKLTEFQANFSFWLKRDT